MQDDYWHDKVCLVTGASAGLGQALATELARRGARLAAVARRSGPLDQLAAKLREATGAEVVSIAGDMAWQEDVDRVQESVASHWGRLDLLVNCVGRSSRRRVLDTSPEDFQQLWDVNFISAVRCTRACSRLLLASSGHVVNIGSLASRFGSAYLGAYPAAKHALAGYTQQLRMEHAAEGLHAMLVLPGPITGSDVDRYAEQAAELPETARRAGGGAKLKGLDPERLAADVLAAAARRRPELVVPRKARLLMVATQLSPRLGDWLLSRYTK